MGLHGWLDNCATFDRLAPMLPLQKLRFISVDLPGHGHSSHLPPGFWYRWPDYVLAVARIVQHLKWEKFSLLSHSMGAKVAFFYTGCFPHHVKRLVSLDVPIPVSGLSRQLLNPSTDRDPSHWDVAAVYSAWLKFMMNFENNLQDQNGSNEVVKNAKTMDDWVKKLMSNMKNYLTHDSARILLNRGTKLVSTDPERYVLSRDRRLDIYDFLTPDNYVDQILKNISCDLLVLMATNSIFKEYAGLDPKRVDQFRRLNVYRVELVEGTHHFHLNNPERMVKTVADFLLSETASKQAVSQ